ncbi:uncharacterized protein DSM5745_11036 [Aspergillus mulundensis]|uniref:RRM domain-containing protein n=1 Tax=Aspergillus mulundensis TaxID=1810919 RepID=A0A3D8QC86_9EURO|nr:hypothetical protein DSM5745_11036 [Aspergillus mulundensis]RDW59341.1 hypothetical protein DSM5745_11036 [Aspergillus mulundensis]
MAPDKKDKKRKAVAATTVDSPAKKTKKVEAKAAEPAENPKSILKKNKTKGAKENKASKPKTDGDAPRSIKPRKRAADYMSDEESEEEVPVKKADKETKAKPSAKKSKKEDGTAAPVKEKSGKKAKKLEIVPSDSEDEEVAPAVEESEEEDDQTTALIRGFESSGDEDESGDEAIDPDAPVPKIPDSKKAKRKILKLQKQNKAESSGNPGVVYVGRIPHGFYEHQMRAYFTQFGEITKLRLSRNRHTGKSKHYAFIEFASESVAKIVAATMDNYLMYGHILKCKYVPSEQLHPELWKGANRRFKATPWNRIEQKRLNKGRTREKWTKNIEQEQKRRLAKAEKLKELGYEMPLPELKSIDEVPFQEPEEEVKAVEGEQEAEAKAIEAPAEPAKADAEKTDDTPKKSKKEKKEKKKAIAEAPVESPKPKAAAAASPATKSKKKSKSKSKA